MNAGEAGGYDPLGLARLGVARAIERAPPIRTRAATLTAALWPPCPLCARAVGDCDCDPDTYAVAVTRRADRAGAPPPTTATKTSSQQR